MRILKYKRVTSGIGVTFIGRETRNRSGKHEYLPTLDHLDCSSYYLNWRFRSTDLPYFRTVSRRLLIYQEHRLVTTEMSPKAESRCEHEFFTKDPPERYGCHACPNRRRKLHSMWKCTSCTYRICGKCIVEQGEFERTAGVQI